MPDQETEPIAKAFQTVQQAEDHRDRADRLVREGEQTIEQHLTDAIPTDCGISATYNPERDEFRAIIEPHEIEDAIGEQFSTEDFGVRTSALHVHVRDGGMVVPAEELRNLRELVEELEALTDEGAPEQEVKREAVHVGLDLEEIDHELDQLKQKGEVYEPTEGYLRTT